MTQIGLILHSSDRPSANGPMDGLTDRQIDERGPDGQTYKNIELNSPRIFDYRVCVYKKEGYMFMHCASPQTEGVPSGDNTCTINMLLVMKMRFDYY